MSKHAQPWKELPLAVKQKFELFSWKQKELGDFAKNKYVRTICAKMTIFAQTKLREIS